MTNPTPESLLKKQARTAGFWYLLMAVVSAFGLLYVPTKLIVEGDAAATAQNIQASELLFRSGIVSTLIGQVLFLFLVLALYRLFKGVHESASKLMVALVIAAVPIAFLNTLNQLGALLTLSGEHLLQAFQPDQLQGLMMLFLKLYEHGESVVGIFWGLWLLPFGFLVIKSGYFPKILGILLYISGVCYFIDSGTFLLFPDGYKTVSNAIIGPQALGEVAMMLWLVIMGAKVRPAAATV